MVDKDSLEFFQKWNDLKKVFHDIAQTQVESDKKRFEEVMGGTFTNLQDSISKTKRDKLKNPRHESLLNEYKKCYQREIGNMTKISTDLNHLMKEMDDDVDKLEKGLAENGVPISVEDKKKRIRKIRDVKRLMGTTVNVQSFDDVDQKTTNKAVLDNIIKEEAAGGNSDKTETDVKTDVKSQTKHKKTRRARNRANKIAKEGIKKKTEDAKKNNKPHDEIPATKERHSSN